MIEKREVGAIPVLLVEYNLSEIIWMLLSLINALDLTSTTVRVT